MIFKKGNIITTNERNAFEILGVNESEICVRDLITEDFSVFSKTEHTYSLFNPKIVLKNCIKEVVDDTEISIHDKEFITDNINILLEKFII